MIASNFPLRTKWPALALSGLTLALLGFVLWRLDLSPRTDDAYVYADTIDVAPEVTGRIVEMAVRDNQAVKRGQLLFRLDARPFQDALDEARARLAVLDKQIMLTRRTVTAQTYNAASVQSTVRRAKAVADKAEDTLRRLAPLEQQGFASIEEVMQARTLQQSTQADLTATRQQAEQAAAAVSGVDALVAQRAVVAADIELAKLNLEYTAVYAPFDGRVVALRTAAGQLASPLKPLFTLIDTRRWYVVANFRETELDAIRPGTPATLYLMSNPSRRFAGKVDSVGYGVLPNDGGLVLQGLPSVQKSINWVHVSQRFPVKILVSDPDPALFRLGTSAVAVVYRSEAAKR